MSRGTWEHDEEDTAPFAYGTVTPYGRTFQIVLLDVCFVTSRPEDSRTMSCPTTPRTQDLSA